MTDEGENMLLQGWLGQVRLGKVRLAKHALFGNII